MPFFILIIQVIALYLCFHLYRGFVDVTPKGSAILLTLFFLVLGESFVLLFFSEATFGIKFPKWVFMISYFCMAISFYLILLYGTSDILKLIKLFPSFSKFKELILFFIISCCVVSYGFYNAKNIKIKEIDISTPKPNIDLKIALITDLHLGGNLVTPNQLKKIVEKTNKLNADLIILGGDIVDSRIDAIKEGGFDKYLKELKASYGVFAILGNHEYYRNNIKDVVSVYKNLGMIVLRDENLNIKPLNINIIGLDDITKVHFGYGNLKSIASLIDKNEFNMLISHNPKRQKEAVDNEVDLFLAGHTHAGQLYPMSLVLKFMYDTVWGFDFINKTNVYISSGIGAWGPPIKIGSDAEIILIEVKSEK